MENSISKDIPTMHTNSNDIELMIGNELDEIIEELFEFIMQRYQKGLEEKMRESEFVFDSVDSITNLIK